MIEDYLRTTEPNEPPMTTLVCAECGHGPDFLDFNYVDGVGWLRFHRQCACSASLTPRT